MLLIEVSNLLKKVNNKNNREKEKKKLKSIQERINTSHNNIRKYEKKFKESW